MRQCRCCCSQHLSRSEIPCPSQPREDNQSEGEIRSPSQTVACRARADLGARQLPLSKYVSRRNSSRLSPRCIMPISAQLSSNEPVLPQVGVEKGPPLRAAPFSEVVCTKIVERPNVSGRVKQHVDYLWVLSTAKTYDVPFATSQNHMLPRFLHLHQVARQEKP